MSYKKLLLICLLLTPLFFVGCLETDFHYRSKFFTTIIGKEETLFRNSEDAIKNAAQFSKKNGQEILTLKNLSTNKTYQAGYFTEISIKDLRKKTKNITSLKQGTFNIIEAQNPHNKPFLHYVDIGALQAHPDNKDAVFQVASNFNALEFTSSEGLQMGNISNYIYDHTQGPGASISAAPGTIQRQYYVFKDNTNTNNPFAWGQTNTRFNHTGQRQKQIDFLDQAGIPTINGYAQLKSILENTIAIEKIKIGFQGDTQVTFGYAKNNAEHKIVTDPNQIVNQVFTAAIDFLGQNSHYKNNQKAIKIAQQVLQAAYEGTLRTAALKGKKKVFLTLVGGGVFGNKIKWIVDCIKGLKDFIKKSGLDVTLVIYNSAGNNQLYGAQHKEDEGQMVVLDELVKETGGGHIRYSPQHPQGEWILKKNQV